MQSLNPQQKKAVETTEGRVLVLAGAGSGKTKVIVHRIVFLISKKNIQPESILGLTFTNKAAQEMRTRISALLSPEIAKKIFLGTFHSFCMRLLRKEIHRLGYTQNFSLYDERDIRRLLKQLANDEFEELSSIEPIWAHISHAKSRGESPQDEIARTLFEKLHKNMQTFNAVDFDSLLTLTVELLEKYPEILAKYQNQYQYILIDEYQDTNPIQYKIAQLLSSKHSNLCVVGDDDQSIYGWRGAEIKNILAFNPTHTIKLEQNYRSLPIILKAANALISHNTHRHEKQLHSVSFDSEPITLFHAPTEKDEAHAVIQRILHLKAKHHLRWRDFAILYRSNVLSRSFEMALIEAMWKKDTEWRRGIPYQIFGGTELFERSEIKDLMAYLRFIANAKDEEALLRIVNVPRRGISDKTLAILTQENRKKNIPLWEVIKYVSSNSQLSAKAIQATENFVQLIEEAKKEFAEKSLKIAMKNLVEKINYRRAIEEEVKSEKMRDFKWENVQNCITSIENFEQETDSSSLQDYLSTTLLDQNRFSQKETFFSEDRVNVMTFHSAKGLEFEATFLVALEDHIIPHEKSLAENRLEEERRLMYVAITRAKKYLTFSLALQRKRYGKEENSQPSRFLFEIPKDLFKIVSWRTPF